MALPPAEIIIRNFTPEDKEAVREICADTAFMGAPVEHFFTDRRAFVDLAISYYTDFEPQSLFVAQADKEVVGYLAGCKDTRQYKRIFSQHILPVVVVRLIFSPAILRIKNLRFFWAGVKSLLKGELRRPDCLKAFPAHLHINIREGFRKQGIGLKLIERYLEYLKAEGVNGLHLYSFSPGGQSFFQRIGFKPIFSRRISYFDYLKPKPETTVVCFARNLAGDKV
ncbi:MAG: GNAT family N-acetyltransferase [Candidatus Omnitrophota bacterium]